ncbi:hypothetical protein BSZ35_14545 [Salinibacter sp. 10B]|uniref:sensor domain-containing protein n=1 Tax=Salinibacter sp. 10B TaxID=1923971 RepID=UPI000CF51C5D|nr:diguanylate cyclase [Salinibacter sp. 10B]PQJ35652.1 hypothetical protein BSZ35_14545 [Salinibacter sp. 10B]
MLPYVEAFSYFRPEEDELPPRKASQIQLYRLLSLLGAVLLPVFGLIRTFLTPEETDPLWARLSISGIIVGLLIASYVWRRVRENYGTWIQVLLYGIVVWSALLAALNQFASDYTVGFLIVFMVGGSVIGFQTRKIGPVLWFAGVGIFGVGAGLVLGAPPEVSPLLLFAGITTVTLIEILTLFWWLSFQETIRQQEEQLQTITENISDGIYRSAPGEGLIYANQAFTEMFGYESVEEILTVRPGALYDDPAAREAVRAQAQEEGKLGPVEVELQRKDGSTFTGRLRGAVVWDEDGTVRFYDGVVTDITQRKRRERELARRKALLEAQAEATIDGLLVVDNERDISFYNERFLEIWNIPKEIVNRSSTEIPLDRILLEAVTELLSRPEEFREKVEYLYDHPDERSRDLIQLTDGRWVDRYSAPISGEDGSHFGRLWVFRDVAEQKRREQKLRHEATHDALTGLPNRAALHEELEGLVEQKRRGALLYLDLDHFKQVNDRFGHDVGDQVLSCVADRLEGVVRDADLVARLGGDEFAVCLSGPTDTETAGRIAKRIYEVLSTAFEVGGQEVYVPPSIGGVTRLSRFGSVEEALSEADAAMYESKKYSRTARSSDQPFVISEASDPRKIDMEFATSEKPH